MSPARRALVEPSDEPLPVELFPVAGGARVLAVAQTGEGAAWARTVDETGSLGPIRGFRGEHVVTAFDAVDGRTTFVTSDGDRLCVSTFGPGDSAPRARGCEPVRPEVAVPIGDRVALVSLDVKEPKAAAAKKKTSATKGGASKKSDAGASKSGKNRVAGGASGKGAPSGVSGGSPGPSKRASPKKKPKPRQKARGEPAPSPPAKAKVSVNVAWASRDGKFDLQSTPAGLTFERPLPGMMLVDAAPRGAGADLLFYEAVARPKKLSKTKFGAARLAVASLGADGLLVAGTRAALEEGDLEYGYIVGRSAPRLVTSAAGAALVTFSGRGGACAAAPVLPALGPAVPTRAACLVDPAGALNAGPSPPPPSAADHLLAAEPRRAPGQVRADSPLVVWAGARPVFTGSGAKPPFVAKRSHVAWSAFAPDGEGVALVAGRVHHADEAGAVTVGEAPSDALGAAAAEAVRRAAGPLERRPAARIGRAFWLARGEVVRVWPSPLARIAALSGRALAGATALVGGRARGMFLELAGGVMRVTFVSESGQTAPGPTFASPVRAGFDAVERTGGGALVAGVSAADPTKVSVLSIRADGTLEVQREASLRVEAGTFAVHLTALPGGGAVLTDLDRTRAVWVADGAEEVGAVALSGDRAAASCVDGEPAPRAVPAPRPGAVVRVAELAHDGTCIVGDTAWTKSGGLRWFGASAQGIDSVAEIGVVEGADGEASAASQGTAPRPRSDERGRDQDSAAASATAPPLIAATASAPAVSAAPAALQAPTAPSGVNKAPCPPDMVSIAGRYCVDRFEGALADGKTGRALSPDYPPTPNLLEIVLTDWATDRAHWGDVHARAFPLPPLGEWQRGAKTEPVAAARFGARPNGYVTGLVAEAACGAAGKRLCSLEEFVTACRGENDTDFPYGVEYQDGVCNVFREDHPAGLLHHNASYGHLDPRLNRVMAKGKPLFETAGARPACRSVWGSDAVYDLVGNLDEWVDEEGGAFAGGFYSRSTRAGCDAVITAHPKVYADYSTGVRCCKDAGK